VTTAAAAAAVNSPRLLPWQRHHAVLTPVRSEKLENTPVFGEDCPTLASLRLISSIL